MAELSITVSGEVYILDLGATDAAVKRMMRELLDGSPEAQIDADPEDPNGPRVNDWQTAPMSEVGPRFLAQVARGIDQRARRGRRRRGG